MQDMIYELKVEFSLVPTWLCDIHPIKGGI